MNAQITRYSPPTVLNPEILRGHNIYISPEQFYFVFKNDEVTVDSATVRALLNCVELFHSIYVARMLLTADQFAEYMLFLHDCADQEKAVLAQQIGPVYEQMSHPIRIGWKPLIVSLVILAAIVVLGILFFAQRPILLMTTILVPTLLWVGWLANSVTNQNYRLLGQTQKVIENIEVTWEQKRLERLLKFFEPATTA